jgi:hypothetical protein
MEGQGRTRDGHGQVTRMRNRKLEAWSRYENLNDLDAEAYRYETRREVSLILIYPDIFLTILEDTS